MDKGTPILVVGNTAHDIIIRDQYPKVHCLGGSAPYVSNVLKGLNIFYHTVSKVGKDFKYFNQCNFTPKVINNSFTTTFVNYTSYVPRKQEVLKTCAPIFSTDIDVAADIGMICGIIGEILPETIKAVRSKSKILIGDIQGLIRIVEENGEVTHRHIRDTINYEFIFLFDYIKISTEEEKYIDIKVLTELGVKVLLTKEGEGCDLLTSNSVTHIPAFPIESIDNTGAGDCFLAGFAAGIHLGLSTYDSIILGHRCGHIAVKSIGIPDIKMFNNSLYNKIHNIL